MKCIPIKFCDDCPYMDDEMPDVFTEGGTYCNHPDLDVVNRITKWGAENIKIPRFCLLKDMK